MALYEHVFIARQDISAQQVEGLHDMIAQILEENGGNVTKTEYWGLKSLAYRVKKNRKGHFSLLNIEADHTAMTEMERRISLSDDIIRHLTLRVTEHEAGDSIQIRNKNREDKRASQREDREGREGYEERTERKEARTERTEKTEKKDERTEKTEKTEKKDEPKKEPS